MGVGSAFPSGSARSKGSGHGGANHCGSAKGWGCGVGEDPEPLFGEKNSQSRAQVEGQVSGAIGGGEKSTGISGKKYFGFCESHPTSGLEETKCSRGNYGGEFPCFGESWGLRPRGDGSARFDGSDDDRASEGCGGEGDCGVHSGTCESGLGVGVAEGRSDRDLSSGWGASGGGDGLWD